MQQVVIGWCVLLRLWLSPWPASHQVSLAISHIPTAVVTNGAPSLEVPSPGCRAQSTKETLITECGAGNEAPCKATFSLPIWVAHKLSLLGVQVPFPQSLSIKRH